MIFITYDAGLPLPVIDFLLLCYCLPLLANALPALLALPVLLLFFFNAPAPAGPTLEDRFFFFDDSEADRPVPVPLPRKAVLSTHERECVCVSDRVLELFDVVLVLSSVATCTLFNAGQADLALASLSSSLLRPRLNFNFQIFPSSIDFDTFDFLLLLDSGDPYALVRLLCFAASAILRLAIAIAVSARFRCLIISTSDTFTAHLFLAAGSFSFDSFLILLA